MKWLVRPPQFVRSLYKDALWRMNANVPSLYLTFDDGPCPTITPQIIEILKDYHIKATFFCVGDNIKRHPAIFENLLQDGHQVANHTFNHLNGWKTSHDNYINNVDECDKLISTKIFRPPYGRITQSQFYTLKKTHKVVFWDIISYDYDKQTSPNKCLSNVINYARNGSIILFHDNIKAKNNVLYTLPKTIEYFSKINRTFALL